MTFSGKLSRGCYTCRKRRVKCDETRPRCERCAKARRVCAGYRDDDDLSFCHQTELTQQRVRDDANRRRSRRRMWSPSSGSTSPPSDDNDVNQNHNQTQNHVVLPLPPSMRSRSLSPSYGLPIPADQEAISSFFENIAHMKTKKAFHTHLPNLYASSRSDTPLVMAVDAVALVLLSGVRGKQHMFSLAQQTYVRALVATQKAVTDPVEVLCDETLVAVLLLAQYENYSVGNVSSWESHVEGAAQMVKMRGEKQLRTAVGQSLCHAIHQRMMLAGVFRQKPLRRLPAHLLPPCERTEIVLRLATALQGLQHLFKDLALYRTARPQPAPSPFSFMSLQSDLMRVDQTLMEWTASLPSTWQYSTVAVVTEEQEADHNDGDIKARAAYPGNIDDYQDPAVNAMWNTYRGGRILLHQLALQLSAWVTAHDMLIPFSAFSSFPQAFTPPASASDSSSPPSSPHTPWSPAQSREAIISLASEICASIPIQLGYDPYAQTQRPAQPAHSLSAQFLIWPLFVVAHCGDLPPAQRMWARGRLQYIREELGLRRAGGGKPDAGEGGMGLCSDVEQVMCGERRGGPLAPFQFTLDRLVESRGLLGLWS